jgi:hypothetical protein
MWKMGRFCKSHRESVSGFGGLRQRFLAQMQEPLLRRQFLEQVLLSNRSVQERMSAQQLGCIGQQSQAPGQTQAVEKYLAQAQLVFLVGLRWLDPRAHLLEQPLGGQTGQGQQPQQSFMFTGSKGKLAPTTGSFPAALTEGRLTTDAKPMPVFQGAYSSQRNGWPCGHSALFHAT